MMVGFRLAELRWHEARVISTKEFKRKSFLD
jgi:hypothetical protein